MTMPALAAVPVRSAAELTARWQALLEPPFFDGRALWLTWLDGDLQLPIVIPIDDLPLLPDRAFLSGLIGLHEAIAAEHLVQGHLAVALCRPGSPEPTADDEAWGEALRNELDLTDETWSLHLAAGGQVTALVDPPSWAWRFRPRG